MFGCSLCMTLCHTADLWLAWFAVTLAACYAAAYKPLAAAVMREIYVQPALHCCLTPYPSQLDCW
jgi:hypothetical protein